jgi:hypothetical protein
MSSSLLVTECDVPLHNLKGGIILAHVVSGMSLLHPTSLCGDRHVAPSLEEFVPADL